ncbi:hypothetical protein CPB83DRAFT_845003 [Crepidotus variabilis]|uniref:Uncharacterized protein n=1 Tax=Crepidotus variabilis TaxID=179855 RepID=A0A9P6ESG4_9AGAR|nr:hypothetical protein CPB83DRAFT_845003 [Crepidotus variabilis]
MSFPSRYSLTSRRHKRWHPFGKRLGWFIFGATITAWLIKRKEMHDRELKWGHCRRPQLQYYLPDTPDESNAHRCRHLLKEISRAINDCNSVWCDAPEHTPHSASFPKRKPPASAWVDAEEDSLDKITATATEYMSELTEASLDAVIETVRAFKVKLLCRHGRNENIHPEAKTDQPTETKRP